MILEHNEVAVAKSAVSFFPHPGKAHKGTLTLTNRRLIFEGHSDAIRSAATPTAAVHWTRDSSFEVDRKDLIRVEFGKGGSAQTCTVRLAESSLEFNFGTANIANIRTAFEACCRPPSRPPSTPARLIRVVACTLVLIVLSDIAGAIVATIVDVLGSVLRNFGGMLILYAIWFVLGIFTGFFIHSLGGGFASDSDKGDWTDRPGAAKTGFLVCAVALPIVVGLAWLSVLFSGESDSIYVPGNTALSVTYFVAIAIGVAGAQYMVSSSKPKSLP
jgi:hypothetical protein